MSIQIIKEWEQDGVERKLGYEVSEDGEVEAICFKGLAKDFQHTLDAQDIVDEL